MSKDFRTVQVTKSELKAALSDNRYWSGNTYIPFTKSKVQWLLDNPRMADKDVCAVLGYEGDELVAFVYLIPDLIRMSKGEKKVFWCRRWWVAPRYKNSVLATYTLNEAVSAVNNQVVIKFLGKEVVEFYKKQPYTEFSERIRYFIVFNLDAHLIASKVGFLKSFKPLLKMGERFSGSVIKWLNNRKIKNATQKLTYEYIHLIDDCTWSFIEKRQTGDFVPKSKEFMNWQLSNNQYTITPVPAKFPYNCLIASSSFQIYHINFNVVLGEQIIGFISILVRSNEFNVKYFITDDQYFEHCTDALIENFNNTRANTIHTENEKLGKKLLERYNRVYVDKRTLYSLAHNDIEMDFQFVQIEDQDGHFA